MTLEQGTQRLELVRDGGVIALHQRQGRHRLSGYRFNAAAPPVRASEWLPELARRVVQSRGEDDVLDLSQNPLSDTREVFRKPFEDRKIAARFPNRVHRRGERVNEGMHIG